MSRSPTSLYLDHAATSWPKAPGVAAAVTRWFEEFGVSADRGDGAGQAEVGATVAAVRSALARMAGVPASHCAFTSGATESLHLLFDALLRDRGVGLRVVTTATEHAAVARPLAHLRDTVGLELDVVGCDREGRVDADDVVRALRERRADLCVLSHASNVTGAVLHAAPILAEARERGVVSVLDASQTLGVLDIALGADFVVASAHKSLLGPPGLGFVLARSGVHVVPRKRGGTGSSRALESHPDRWPTCLEAGTPNTPALFGLGAALDWSLSRDRDANRARTLAALEDLWQVIERSGRFRRHSPASGERLPILSIDATDHDPAELAAVLASADIATRSGFHCAPWIHQSLGTQAAGTLRLSPGPFVTADDLMRAAEVLAR